MNVTDHRFVIELNGYLRLQFYTLDSSITVSALFIFLIHFMHRDIYIVLIMEVKLHVNRLL